MKKILLTYGIIAGLIVSVMMVLTFGIDIGLKGSELLGYTTMVVAFSTIFIAIRTYRNNYLGGSISFGKGFLLGLYITLIASALYVISWMILSETVAKDYMDNYFNEAVEQIRQSSDLTQAEMDAKISEMDKFREMYKNPVVKIGMTFMEIFPVGLLITLISAAILRRKETANA
ncbi:MAG: DUF4199 domain-containing protein [Bacteroidales bacterium]|nr:DUF4199 domain-containing protein [Bacteroidales bacterium]